MDGCFWGSDYNKNWFLFSFLAVVSIVYERVMATTLFLVLWEESNEREGQSKVSYDEIRTNQLEEYSVPVECALACYS